jgi:hypothetical protein
MKESYTEGLANHSDPESCGYVGNNISEALTGAHTGRVLSLEKILQSGCRRRFNVRKAKQLYA